MQLVRYEAARTALAECHRVDEVKDIRDVAKVNLFIAVAIGNAAGVAEAIEIKLRAERRIGQLLAAGGA